MIRSFEYAKSWLSALVAYPIAEYLENRDIRSKRNELRKYYKLDYTQRKQIMKQRLADIVEYASVKVPYYKDLFKVLCFDPAKLRRDSLYLLDLPYLNKDIVKEQGVRLLSQDLDGLRHYNMKTGGSTGLSAHFLYDQEAIDYSAAVVLYARECVGKMKHRSELHFACRFPDASPLSKWTREDWKCLAMNRANIFFDRLDSKGLDEIWRTLRDKKPYLIHGHPSTIYALAKHLEKTKERVKAFTIFESSGELLESHQREVISKVLQCKVINRYGLAELGVIAYQLGGDAFDLQVMESEVWPETLAEEDTGRYELVFTGFRNKLMPLIRYRTGDMAQLVEESGRIYISNLLGRIHEMVPINGIPYPTHHIMDILDHRVGGIEEFQIDLSGEKPVLRIAVESGSIKEYVRNKVYEYWADAFEVQFVSYDEFVRVGWRQKFRHIVQ